MEDCPICYEAVTDSTGHCTLSCKHSFHISCLTKWSNETPSCPMCRNPLGTTEAPAKQIVESHDMSRWWIHVGQGQGAFARLIQEALGPEPPQPPPPTMPRPSRIINIGGGVQVSEEDVALVMEHAHATRGEAIRALRRHEGCIVNSIMMLIERSEAAPRAPEVRDPLQECSDDQATAWFLQELFNDTSYHWNSYSDMRYRMHNNIHKHEYWMHREFQMMETRTKLEAGYESA